MKQIKVDGATWTERRTQILANEIARYGEAAMRQFGTPEAEIASALAILNDTQNDSAADELRRALADSSARRTQYHAK